MSKAASVYFIQCNGDEGPIKIGRALNPVRRLSELRIGCPYPMVLLATMPCDDAEREEYRLHKQFRALWIHGEWFRYSHRLRTLAMDIAKHQARLIAADLGIVPRATLHSESK